MKVTYNITQNKFNVKFQTGYYPLPGGGGGGGVVDTSNLVPYTGANKDVNIASNYFKTSKGFDFTFGVSNYFKVSENGENAALDFRGSNSLDYIAFKIQPQIGLYFIYSDINNNNNVNVFTVTKFGVYAKKGFVTDEGFQISGGTATQALTADGGTFDLNTKADLVGGKVPQSQLPSIGKTTFTYDILVSNWTLVSGKYEAVISNAGILSNSFVDVIPSNDNVDIVRNAQIYPSVLISAGSVKVYSKFLPSGTISVTVNII